MKKILSVMCATALTASVAVTSVVPTEAAPAYVPQPATAGESDVVQVQDGYIWRRRMNRNRARFDNDRVVIRSGTGFYRGHRGYRYRRPGFRYHDGFWFPAAAFLTGALVTGAIINSDRRRVYRGASAHVEWCYDRYRSYREFDNTWQPYNGPRRECISPYM